MAVPGIGTVFGVAAALLYRFLDPRRKEDKLLAEKRKIATQPQSNRRAHRLQWIDDELAVVRKAIRRRAS